MFKFVVVNRISSFLHNLKLLIIKNLSVLVYMVVGIINNSGYGVEDYRHRL